MPGDLLAWVIAAGGLLTAFAAFSRWVVRPVWIRGRQVYGMLVEFLGDWRGEPARPGVPGRPGVMSRLERLEWHQGNGAPESLREVVERQGETLERVVARLELDDDGDGIQH